MNQPERQTDHKPDSVSKEQVHNYLSNHADFFSENLDLLEILEIPHPSGSAVSLVEKQLQLFRDKNEKILQQLNILVQIARDNDDLFQRMHRLTLCLLEAQSLEDALINLESVLHQYFKADFVSIRILRDVESSAFSSVFIPADDECLESFEKIIESGRPKCGPPDPDQADFLYGDNASQVRSCATIPMASGDLTALMGIGSVDEDRFLPTMGHMFLTQMGEQIGYRLNTLLHSDN